jgi:hypothetical protein
MEKENFVLLMDKLTKEIGRMVKKMVKENIVMLVDQLIKEIIRMIKHMDNGNIHLKMVTILIKHGSMTKEYHQNQF